MACENQVGIRNILIKFYDCDTDTSYGPIAHELSGDEQPQYRLCEYNNEPLPGGYVRRTRGNNEIQLTVIRNIGIPLALYQGCAAVDVTIEHFNGLVVTGINGTGTGDDSSDGHEVTLTATFKQIDELLPVQVAAAA
jgi:hypothetical protein